MSKKLAIRGHSTRGKEVIELLEMMGGSNMYHHNGEANAYSYYISNNVILHDRLSITEDDDFEIFTLQGFLEKFPFKVGDFVRIPEYESEVGICGMLWDPLCNCVEYMVYRNDDEEWYTAEELLNYNNNPMRGLDDVYSVSTCKTTKQGTYAIKIADGYKFDSIDENGNIIVKAIKSKYPTTYKECCEVLMGKTDFSEFSLTLIKYSNSTKFDNSISPDAPHTELFNNLYKIVICRDAYWKIAGEQMGLGKSWEPDWNHINRKFYCIYNSKNNIVRNVIYSQNKILAFPTEEMRDAFYENFKELIKACKELL